MNALSIIPTNACPDKYRNLSPKVECHLRSIRLGIPETPGRLPMSMDEKRGLTTAEMKARQDAIIELLRKKPRRSVDVYIALGITPQVAHNALSAMSKAGLVEYRKEGRARPVWALAVQP